MLLGEYKHNLDAKGRMAIPSKFREKLSAGAVVTRGLDSCLFVFGKTEWEDLAKKISSFSFAQSNSRAFQRLILSGATDVTFDKQGRILIPEHLRNYAGLKKEVVVTGVATRAEIWDETKWNAYKQKTESASDEIAERLGELGI